MKTPNGQFSLWESEKLTGFGMCYMTSMCFRWFLSSPRNVPLWKDAITLALFQASIGYTPLLGEKYLYLVAAFITQVTLKLNQDKHAFSGGAAEKLVLLF